MNGNHVMPGEPMEEPEDEDELEEHWVTIQKDTFTNWVNDKLRSEDGEYQMKNIKTDFCDGVEFCKLAQILTGAKKMGKVINKKKMNHYECSGNIALALQTLQQDGVRLVNIGAEDIAGSNLKLILGMLWILIRKYQIGSGSRLPPKKMMLEWVNAILHPHYEVANFSTDWNNGIALHGVIEYCQPGTFPTWYRLATHDKVGNCEVAINKASDVLGIPIVVSPENFASHNLDELSGMTYLSYYMKKDAPGYNATLNWVNNTIKQQTNTNNAVENFTTSWNNGYAISCLVNALGGSISSWSENKGGRSNVVVCKDAMQESEKSIGVRRIINEKDMSNPEVDHICIMAYAAWHRALGTPGTPQPYTAPYEPKPVAFVPKRPATPPPPARLPSPPPILTAPPPITEQLLGIYAPTNWPVNSPTTIQISTTDVGEGTVTGLATNLSSGVKQELNVEKVAELRHLAPYTPTEIGQLQVTFTFNSNEISAQSVYNVYDASQAKIILGANGSNLKTQQLYTFKVSTLGVGLNDVHAIIEQDGTSVEYQAAVTGPDSTAVTFTPTVAGYYSVQVYCGGIQVPGSPLQLHATNVEEAKILHNVNSPIPVNDPYSFDGPHEIDVAYDQDTLPASPYIANVKPPRVYVRNLQPTAFRSQEFRFEMDASEFTNGTIELDSNLPVRRYDKVGQRKYEVTIVPFKVGVHDITIKMDGLEVAGSPFTVHVEEMSY